MLTQVADGVLVHQSEFCQTNSVVVQGPSGVLLIDPGQYEHELGCLANDLDALGQPVVAAFATHPHWDHVLWHVRLGAAPRYGTQRCAGAVASARGRLSNAQEKAQMLQMIPPDIAEQIDWDLFGLVTGVPAEATEIPWDGPSIRIIEHQAHAPGHAALLIEGSGALVAGDMLSDVLIPLLDLSHNGDPIEDYLDALRSFEGVASDVAVVIPGHGSVGDADQLRERIELDRAYVQALRDGEGLDDPRVDARAKEGFEWVADVHAGQSGRVAERNGRQTQAGADT